MAPTQIPWSGAISLDYVELLLRLQRAVVLYCLVQLVQGLAVLLKGTVLGLVHAIESLVDGVDSLAFARCLRSGGRCRSVGVLSVRCILLLAIGGLLILLRLLAGVTLNFGEALE